MVSFQHRFASGLRARGIDVCYDLTDHPYQGILVIGGTRQVFALRRARQSGIPVVQRLDGMNWVHRLRRTGLKHYLRAEYGNALLSYIRNRIADYVVYQSRFSEEWWERKYGSTATPSSVVYNGVDLNIYSPGNVDRRPDDFMRILLVEGSLMGGYELGLELAIKLGTNLETRLASAKTSRKEKVIEVLIVGKVAPETQGYWENQINHFDNTRGLVITWAGLVTPDLIPDINRSAHLLFSADINAACPNSVIEALACGTPVAAFDTGALAELVVGGAGRLVPYGGDPWKLGEPDIPALVQASFEILESQERYCKAARSRAEHAFSLDTMVDGYLRAFSKV